jgi:hypothetical protein
MRDFLEHTNMAGEMQKLLTTVQFEINTTIRFRPNEPGAPAQAEDEAAAAGEPRPASKPDATSAGAAAWSKPEVKTEVHMSRAQRKERRRQQRMSQGGGGPSGGGEGTGGETT